MIIDEPDARAPGERAADGVFAGAREADENYEGVIEGAFKLSILVSTKAQLR